jgi:putative membrane protein
MIRAGREPLVLFGIGVVLLFFSGLHPFDRMTWALEVAPILIAVPVLFGTYRRFPFTPLVYRLIFLHAVVLMVGGHYTYERVPVGFWFRDVFHLSRNHYDRFGHLVQGFVPAIIAREVLLRVARLRRGALLFLLVTSVCLAVSALYELFEWAMALLLGQGADAFLATQGDPWDTQEDMLMALIGAIVSQLSLARVHDRQLEALPSQPVRASRAA